MMSHRTLLKSIAYLLSSLIIMMALLVGTPIGTRILLGGLSQLQSQLTYTYKSGTFAQGLTLSNIQLTTPPASLFIGNLSSQWRLGCLFHQHVCLEQLALSDVTLSLTPQSSPANATEPASPSLSLPVSVTLNAVALNNVHIESPQANLSWQQLDMAGNLTNNHLTLKHINWLAPVVTIHQPPHTPSKQAGAPVASAKPPLAEFALPITGNIEQAHIHQLAIHSQAMSLPATDITIQADWQTHHIHLQQLALTNRWLTLSHQLNMALQPPFDVDANVTLHINDISEFKLPIPTKEHTLKLALHGNRLAMQLNADISGQWQAHIGATIRPDEQFAYTGELTLSQLALATPRPIHIHQLTLNSRGDKAHQQVQLDGLLQHHTEPEISLVGLFEHHAKQLSITQLQLANKAAGTLALTGELNYQQGIHWKGSLSAEAFDIHTWLPEITSSFSGSAHTEAQFHAPDWQLAVSDLDIHGQLMQQNMLAQGQLALTSDWQVPHVDLALEWGNIALNTTGSRNVQWAIQSTLTTGPTPTPLAGITPALSGELLLSGEAPLPEVALNMRGALSTPDVALQGIKLAAHYMPNEQHHFDTQLNIAHAQYQQWQTNAVELQATGDALTQQLSVSSQGEYAAQLRMAHQSDAKQQGGQLTIEQLSVITPWQHMQLEQHTSLVWDTHAAQLSELCMQGDALSLCLATPLHYNVNNQQLNAALDIALNTAPFSPYWLPPSIKLDTQLSGQALLALSPQSPHVTFALQGTGGQLYHQAHNQQHTILAWDALQASSQLDDRRMHANLSLLADNTEQLSISMASANIEQQLNASVQLAPLSLAPYAYLFSDIAHLTGELGGSVELTHTTGTTPPSMAGSMALTQGGITLHSNPTQITDADVSLLLAQQHAKIQGEFMVGGGNATVAGQLNWAHTPQATANITTQGAEIIYPPYLVAKANTQLALHYAKQITSVSGTLAIPSGQITLDTLPAGAADISDDVIYLPEETSPPLPAQFNIDVDLHIGDDLLIAGQGVTGALSGQLDVKQTPTTPLQLFGSLNLLNGRYTAWGQDLQVEQGKVTFYGLPSEPTLDLKAFRHISHEDVTAGVELSGTPSVPQLRFYSSPAMPQPEILSYIVQGRGLRSEGDGNFATAAALSAGVALTQDLFKQLDALPVISDVAIDTQGSGAQTQVTISSQIGERIALKYGVGVFEPINELTVRLTLLNKLWLETISGIEQSVDLYYNFDIE